MHAVDEGLRHLKASGSMEAMLPRMQHRKELYELLGYTPGARWNYPRG
jgi:2-methylisocitrate lyase-like PEP mutase family enzyme